MVLKASTRDFLPEIQSSEPALAVSNRESDILIEIPVARDGSFFGPHLCKKSRFCVGDKGDERYFSDFHEALAYLKSMKVARWRRPNSDDHWGIVAATKWELRPIKIL